MFFKLFTFRAIKIYRFSTKLVISGIKLNWYKINIFCLKDIIKILDEFFLQEYEKTANLKHTYLFCLISNSNSSIYWIRYLNI